MENYEKATLPSDYDKTIKIQVIEGYTIDYDKVKTLEDVITILKGLDFIIYENYPHFEELKHLLKPNK